MNITPRRIEELRDTGLLWLINRVALHPRGFALALVYEDGSETLKEPRVVGWTLLGNGREVWSMDPEVDDEKFAAVERLLRECADTPADVTIEAPRLASVTELRARAVDTPVAIEERASGPSEQTESVPLPLGEIILPRPRFGGLFWTDSRQTDGELHIDRGRGA